MSMGQVVGLVEELYLMRECSVTNCKSNIPTISTNICSKICIIYVYQNWEVGKILSNIIMSDC